MVVLPANRYRNLGMTLIEVLIALAIVGIAMTAIIKASTENIRATRYLQNKTMAMWVAEQVVNEARVGLLALPGGEQLKQKTTLLGQEWYWQAIQEETTLPNVKKIAVKVFDHEDHENDEAPLITLEGESESDNEPT